MENSNTKIWRMVAGALFGILQLFTIWMLNQIDARFTGLEARENRVEQRLVRVETLLHTFNSDPNDPPANRR